MKYPTLLGLLVVLPLSASAQDSSRQPSPPASQLSAGTPEACRIELRKYCEAVNLKQECLVAHWDHITDTCQNGLLIPMRSNGGGG